METHIPRIKPRHIAASVLLACTVSLPMYLYIRQLPRESQEIAAQGDWLSIVTFNTEYWHSSERDLVNAIDYANMDLVLLQEHLEKRGDKWYATDRIQQLKQVVENRYIASSGEVVTLSRWPIVAWKAFSDGRPDGQVLRTDVAVPGSIVSVYNMHLPVHLHTELIADPVGFYLDARRSAGRRQETLNRTIADIAANPHPVIIGGDFNSSLAMNGVSWFRSHFSDAVSGAHCAQPAHTFGRGQLFNWRIDYIYASPGLKPATYCTRDLPGISDHRAVFATFKRDAAAPAAVASAGSAQ